MTSTAGSSADSWENTPAIIPQNMTGAGSLRAVNYPYSIAPKDGSVIGTFSRTLVLAPLLNGADALPAQR